MAQSVTDCPRERQMAPDFVLPSSKGLHYQLSQWRGRRNLVLIFTGNGESSTQVLLRELVSRQTELEEEETVVLVILHGDIAAAEVLSAKESLPFPVLADEAGDVQQRYAAPSVYLTDRYGKIYGAYHDGPPQVDDLMDSVRHINAACPE
jgi:peroxiredoxin